MQEKNAIFLICTLTLSLTVFTTSCKPAEGGHPQKATTDKTESTNDHSSERQKENEKTMNKVVTLPERQEIDDKYKWNPSIIFKNEQEWENELKRVTDELPTLKDCSGKLTSSVKVLKKCLDRIYNFQNRIHHLMAYASRIYDTDIRKSKPQAMSSSSEKLYTEFLSTISFVEPELLELSEQKLRKLASRPELKDYDRELLRLLRLKKHVLSKPEETILAQASAMGLSPHNIYKTFSNAEMKFPQFKDQEGRSIELSAATYAKYRKSQNREVRKQVFNKFWTTYKSYRSSFSQMLSSQIQYYDFVAKARNYKNALESSLKPNAIPAEFYPKLIKAITAHLDVFHRYLKLRKKLLKIEGEQYYYDIYPLAVAKTSKNYGYKEAQNILPTALAPLGEDYIGKLTKSLEDGSGWLDVYPNQGKRSGAYSSSVYGRHPLVLLNYTDDFDSLTTTAHEMGHALHSAYSMKTQPFAKAHYSLFVAEVASIFNETLLIEYLLEKETDPEHKKFLLSAYLDSFRGTVFRQTMFAEFELEAYRRLAARKPLTADSLSNLYLELLRKYHGHDKNIMNIEPLYGVEWAYIPHFYYHFYVYQYASGFVAATALAQKVLKEGEPAAKRYIENLLKAGGSEDPLEILKNAGVDMTSAEPYEMAAKKFAERVAELEELAEK